MSVTDRLKELIEYSPSDYVGDTAQVALDRIAALEAALREIARQKQTDELEEHEVDCADFENGYDILISRARAAIRPEQDK